MFMLTCICICHMYLMWPVISLSLSLYLSLSICIYIYIYIYKWIQLYVYNYIYICINILYTHSTVLHIIFQNHGFKLWCLCCQATFAQKQPLSCHHCQLRRWGEAAINNSASRRLNRLVWFENTKRRTNTHFNPETCWFCKKNRNIS